MNKIFAFCIFTASASAIFGANATERAQAELDSAMNEYAEFQKNVSAERAALQKQTDAVLKKIADLRAETAKAEAERNEVFAVGEKSRHYDMAASEIYSDMRVFSENFLGRPIEGGMASRSAAEAYGLAAIILPDAREKVFNPLQLRPSKSAAAKGNKVYDGEEFRVGGFRYFIGDGVAGFLTADSVLYGENFGAQIIGFAAGQSDEIPADTSGGELLKRQKTKHTWGEEIAMGGIWMYPILFFGALALAVGIVKAAAFSRIRRMPRRTLSVIFSHLENGDEKQALKVAGKAGYPYGGLLAELIKSRKLNSAMLEEISYESMLTAGEKLFSGLSVLSVTAAVSPLFGLLGTVTGIIKIFADLSFHGTMGDAKYISAGISEVLISTEYGLIVAIPAFVAHAVLSRRAKAVLANMEKLASGFISSNKRND